MSCTCRGLADPRPSFQCFGNPHCELIEARRQASFSSRKGTNDDCPDCCCSLFVIILIYLWFLLMNIVPRNEHGTIVIL